MGKRDHHRRSAKITKRKGIKKDQANAWFLRFKKKINYQKCLINKNKDVIIKEKTTRERQPQSKEERAEATSKGFKKKTNKKQLNRNERRKMTWKQSS